jgi:hypothetical protein
MKNRALLWARFCYVLLEIQMKSLSATAFSKFYWMRYTSDRSTNVTLPNFKIRIQKGHLFGVREVRGSNTDEVALVDGTRFRLDVKKSDVLMSRAKDFKGKIPVEQKKTAKKPTAVKQTAKPKSTQKPKASPKSVPKIVISKKLNPKITKITQTKDRIKLSEVEMPDVDDFTDYDIPQEFQRYARVESSAKKRG